MTASLKDIRWAENNIEALAKDVKSREDFRAALTRLGISLSSPRAHSAMSDYFERASRIEVAVLLDRAFTHERAAREKWVDECLAPWCERHGITLQQGLSIAFDDGEFDPQNPKQPLPTMKSLFAWTGQQNDFAARLQLELSFFDPERLSPTALSDADDKTIESRLRAAGYDSPESIAAMDWLAKNRPTMHNSVLCRVFDVACYRVGESCFAADEPPENHGKWFVSVLPDSVLELHGKRPDLDLADTLEEAQSMAVQGYELARKFVATRSPVDDSPRPRGG